jgi:hypothetical protein
MLPAGAAMTPEEEEPVDEILGRTRCARCGQRLDGEIECPFCSHFPDPPAPAHTPVWIVLTAVLLVVLFLWFVLFW